MLGAACRCCVGRSNKLLSNGCAQNVLCKRCQWCKTIRCLYTTLTDYIHAAFAEWSWNTTSRSQVNGTALTLIQKLQCVSGQSCHTESVMGVSVSVQMAKCMMTIINWHWTPFLLGCCVEMFDRRVLSMTWRSLSGQKAPLPWPLLNQVKTSPSICV